MSYDLYFYAKQGTAFSGESFVSYFTTKPKFTVSDVDAGGFQAWYENEDTGVYFCLEFSFDPSRDEEGIPSGLFDTGVSFNLNYNRPSFFAFEAMPLVVSFADEFQLYIYDPQDHREGDMKIERYVSADDLIHTWTTSNVGAVEIYREKGATEPYLPLEKSLDMWRYMYVKSLLNDSLPEFFVPKYFLLRKKAEKKSLFRRGTTISKEVLRVVVWGEGVFQLLPECDYFIIVKGEASNSSDKGLIRYEEVMSQVRPYLVSVDNEHMPNLQGIPECNIEHVLPIFRRFRTVPMDNYEGVPMDAFVDVPWTKLN